jgi:hypothetical protein
VIDPLEVVIKWLAADAALAELVSGRVASKHRYGDAVTGWLVSQAGLMVRLDGGLPDLDATLQPIRLELRCYASSQVEATAIWRRLVEISRDTDRRSVMTTNGGGLLYRFNQSSGPSMLYDQDAKLDFVMAFFDALVAEGEVP